LQVTPRIAEPEPQKLPFLKAPESNLKSGFADEELRFRWRTYKEPRGGSDRAVCICEISDSLFRGQGIPCPRPVASGGDREFILSTRARSLVLEDPGRISDGRRPGNDPALRRRLKSLDTDITSYRG
jgi:hypothetical protein